MKELTGIIRAWDPKSGRGEIRGDNGASYAFSDQQWTEVDAPEIEDSVRFICQDGRNVSKVEYVLIEHIPRLTITTHSPDGNTISSEQRRFIGGPWRMRSDALAWMITSRTMHVQTSSVPIQDISNLLIGDHLPISVRGSVVKYCYGMAFELYLKWILTEAGVSYPDRGGDGHRLARLLSKLPDAVLREIGNRYLAYQQSAAPEFRLTMAHVHGVEPVTLDWSTFEQFVRNLDDQQFVTGRYAAPSNYSAFRTLSGNLSKEMNVFIDSDDFFDWGISILGYEPDLGAYS